MNTQSNILFLPIDIPMIPGKSQILKTFASHSQERYIWWNREIIFGDKDYHTPLGAKNSSWFKDAHSKYSMLIHHLKSFLPFQEFAYIHLARPNQDIAAYVDENYVESPRADNMSVTPEFRDHLLKHEPVGYRFLIEGNRESLYLCEQYDPSYQTVIQQKKHYCCLPPETDFFLFEIQLNLMELT